MAEWLQSSPSHLAQIKVLLCGIEGIWENREPLQGPDPSQDQQRNQDSCSLHPVETVCPRFSESVKYEAANEPLAATEKGTAN